MALWRRYLEAGRQAPGRSRALPITVMAIEFSSWKGLRNIRLSKGPVHNKLAGS